MKKIEMRVIGHHGSQLVSVITFNSDDPNSNPDDTYSFSVKFVFEKKSKISKKEAGVGPFFKKGNHERTMCSNT